MFREEIEDLKNRYLTRLALHHVFSREPQDAPIFEGRLDRERLAAFLGPLIDPKGIDEAFVCGPYEMNNEAEAALRAAGVPPERIHVERFGAPPLGAAPAHPVLAGDAVAALLEHGPQVLEVGRRHGHGSGQTQRGAIEERGRRGPRGIAAGVGHPHDLRGAVVGDEDVAALDRVLGQRIIGDHRDVEGKVEAGGDAVEEPVEGADGRGLVGSAAAIVGAGPAVCHIP